MPASRVPGHGCWGVTFDLFSCQELSLNNSVHLITRSGKPSSSKYTARGWGVAQSVERLLCKQEELSPTSGTYVKSLTAYTCTTRPGEVEAEDSWAHWPASGAKLVGSRFHNIAWKGIEEDWRLTPNLHMSNPPTHALILTHMCTCMHKHVHIQTHRTHTVEN